MTMNEIESIINKIEAAKESDLTDPEFFHPFIDKLRELQEKVNLLESAHHELKQTATELADAVENREDVGIHKWAVKTTYLVNKARQIIKDDPHQVSPAIEIEAVERFVCWLKSDRHLDKETHDNAVDYINELTDNQTDLDKIVRSQKRIG